MKMLNRTQFALFQVLILAACAGSRTVAVEKREPQPEPRQSSTAKPLVDSSPQPRPPATNSPGCQTAADDVAQLLWRTRVAKNVAGLVEQAFERSRASLAECPDSEGLWYAFLRTSELRSERFPVDVGSIHVRSVLEGARIAASKFESSVRIRTVLARSLGSEAAAQEAVALDPGYAPARLALASALIEAGQFERSLRELDAPGLRAYPGASATRARALLMLGRVHESARAARHELLQVTGSGVEPYEAVLIQADAEEVLGRALIADHHATEGRDHLRSAAAMGSTTARELLTRLEHPEP